MGNSMTYTSVEEALDYIHNQKLVGIYNELLLCIHLATGQGINDPVLFDLKLSEGDIPDAGDPFFYNMKFEFHFPETHRTNGLKLINILFDRKLFSTDLPAVEMRCDDQYRDKEKIGFKLTVSLDDISIEQIKALITASLEVIYTQLDDNSVWSFLYEDSEGPWSPIEEFYPDQN